MNQKIIDSAKSHRLNNIALVLGVTFLVIFLVIVQSKKIILPI